VNRAGLLALDVMTTSHASRKPSPRRLTAPPNRGQAAYARSLAKNVNSIRDPLTLERWASSFLGRVWERGRRHREDPEHDYGFALGAAMVEAIGDAGGRGARMALLAISRLDDGTLAWHAEEWADSLSRIPVPKWVDAVGEAEVVRATSISRPGDGEGLFIEVDQPSIGLHTVAAFIRDDRGGVASYLGLIQPFDVLDFRQFEAAAGHRRPARREEVEPTVACHRLRAAITNTDRNFDVDVRDEYADLRALALNRAVVGELADVRSGAPPG
jgi:hypothetical protein